MVRKNEVSAKRPTRKDGCVVVCDKYEIPFELFERVNGSYMQILPVLMKETDYTTADLCGDELWATLSSNERLQAFLCLKQIAVDPYGEMELVSSGEDGQLYFRLI